MEIIINIQMEQKTGKLIYWIKMYFITYYNWYIITFFRPKFTNDFQVNGHNKSTGNGFKESMKSRTHLGFGGDGKY